MNSTRGLMVVVEMVVLLNRPPPDVDVFSNFDFSELNLLSYQVRSK